MASNAPDTNLPISISQDSVTQVGHYITPIATSRQLTNYHASLRDLLQLCVNTEPASSSIGFYAPLLQKEADEYWLDISSKIDQSPSTVFLFILTDSAESQLVLATAQIHIIPKATHQHRAEVAKLLVHPLARRRGFGKSLMDFIERYSCNELKRDLLNLDTATETSAMNFYKRTGWTEWGTCPDYAEYADHNRGSATFFYKFVGRHSEVPN